MPAFPIRAAALEPSCSSAAYRLVDMESFLIYRCADGGYLFCPDCVQASIKAEHNYGPLELLGIISRAELDEIVAAKVEQEVADHLYAHVDAGQVETLDLDLAVHSDSQ